MATIENLGAKASVGALILAFVLTATAIATWAQSTHKKIVTVIADQSSVIEKQIDLLRIINGNFDYRANQLAMLTENLTQLTNHLSDFKTHLATQAELFE